MSRSNAGKLLARTLIVAVLSAALGSIVTGCGQRGPLYMADPENPDKRR